MAHPMQAETGPSSHTSPLWDDPRGLGRELWRRHALLPMLTTATIGQPVHLYNRLQRNRSGLLDRLLRRWGTAESPGFGLSALPLFAFYAPKHLSSLEPGRGAALSRPVSMSQPPARIIYSSPLLPVTEHPASLSQAWPVFRRIEPVPAVSSRAISRPAELIQQRSLWRRPASSFVGYPLEAGQSDPGSAGVLAGLSAPVTVNSRQDAGAPRGVPLRSALKVSRLKWIPSFVQWALQRPAGEGRAPPFSLKTGSNPLEHGTASASPEITGAVVQTVTQGEEQPTDPDRPTEEARKLTLSSTAGPWRAIQRLLGQGGELRMGAPLSDRHRSPVRPLPELPGSATPLSEPFVRPFVKVFRASSHESFPSLSAGVHPQNVVSVLPSTRSAAPFLLFRKMLSLRQPDTAANPALFKQLRQSGKSVALSSTANGIVITRSATPAGFLQSHASIALPLQQTRLYQRVPAAVPALSRYSMLLGKLPLATMNLQRLSAEGHYSRLQPGVRLSTRSGFVDGESSRTAAAATVVVAHGNSQTGPLAGRRDLHSLIRRREVNLSREKATAIMFLSDLWNHRFEPPRRYAPPLLIQGGEIPQPVQERYSSLPLSSGPPLTGTGERRFPTDSGRWPLVHLLISRVSTVTDEGKPNFPTGGWRSLLHSPAGIAGLPLARPAGEGGLLRRHGLSSAGLASGQEGSSAIVVPASRELQQEQVERSPVGIAGYPLKAGQSDPDPGSAGVLAGLSAWVTVNSQQDAGAPRGTPLRSARKASRLKWIPGIASPTVPASSLSASAEVAEFNFPTGGGQRLLSRSLLSRASALAERLAERGKPNFPTGGWRSLLHSPVGIAGLQLARPVGEGGLSRRHGLSSAGLASGQEERGGVVVPTSRELQQERVERSPMGIAGYLLKAGQSDPGSAGVLAGLRAWVTVNRWQDAGAPRGIPLRLARKASRLKWIPGIASPTIPASNLSASAEAAEFNFPTGGGQRLLSRSLLSRASALAERLAERGEPNVLTGGWRSLPHSPAGIAGLQLARPLGEGGLLRRHGLSNAGLASGQEESSTVVVLASRELRQERVEHSPVGIASPTVPASSLSASAEVAEFNFPTGGGQRLLSRSLLSRASALAEKLAERSEPGFPGSGGWQTLARSQAGLPNLQPAGPAEETGLLLRESASSGAWMLPGMGTAARLTGERGWLRKQRSESVITPHTRVLDRFTTTASSTHRSLRNRLALPSPLQLPLPLIQRLAAGAAAVSVAQPADTIAVAPFQRVTTAQGTELRPPALLNPSYQAETPSPGTQRLEFLPLLPRRPGPGDRTARLSALAAPQDMPLVTSLARPEGVVAPAVQSSSIMAMPISSPTVTGENPGIPAATAARATAGPSTQPDMDELVEKIWRKLMRKLSVEQERRGWNKWP